jgi:hypothetical protein
MFSIYNIVTYITYLFHSMSVIYIYLYTFSIYTVQSDETQNDTCTDLLKWCGDAVDAVGPCGAGDWWPQKKGRHGER